MRSQFLRSLGYVALIVVLVSGVAHADAYTLYYVRAGYGTLFGGGSSAGPGAGMGFRRERDAFAIDVSFFNYQSNSDRDYAYRGGSSSSLLKLEALRFMNHTANATPYFGGGLSWGSVNAHHADGLFRGIGLQGEITAGYEALRASTIRLFVQTDVVLPFYSAKAEIFRARMAPITERRYIPSASLSVGMGWGPRR
jgi:hypothetical protein